MNLRKYQSITNLLAWWLSMIELFLLQEYISKYFKWFNIALGYGIDVPWKSMIRTINDDD